MKNKKILILIIVGIIIAIVAGDLWYTSWSNQKSDDIISKVALKKVTIGVDPWPGLIALYVAQDKGYFTDEGIDVELRSNSSLADSSQDYQKGLIQGQTNLTDQAIIETQSGLHHKVVLQIDYSNGADGIIAGPSITNLQGIKGHKVAYEFGTLEEYFLQYALTEVGLSTADIQSVNLNPQEAADALIKKEVDVAVTYEPYMSTVLKMSGFKKIYSSTQAPGLISDILTFHDDFIQKSPDVISAVLRAYFRGFDFIKSNPDEAYSIMAKVSGSKVEELVDQLSGIKLLDLSDNRGAFTYSPGLQSIYSNLRRTAAFISKQNQKPVLDTDVLVDPKFINALWRTPSK